MGQNSTEASLGGGGRRPRPPLFPGARQAPAEPSAATRTLLTRPAVWASLLAHVGLLLALILLALSQFAPPPIPPVLKVSLLTEGPGAAGAAGGAGGGGGDAKPASPPAAAAAEPPSPATPPSPPPSPDSASAAAEAAPVAAPSPAITADAAKPAPSPEKVVEEPLPPPPRRKPSPPQRITSVATISAPPRSVTPLPSPPPQGGRGSQSSSSSPSPLEGAAAPKPPGEPGSGSGVASAVGRGIGDEGAGHGAVGDGPVTGPGDDYLDRLRRWLARYRHYPEAAKKAQEQGQLVVSFTILRNGTVIDPHIERSSGFPLLDEAALKMLHDASPVPPLPETYRAQRLDVGLPVNFSIGLVDRLF
jgi:periplasmic protein TonB